VYKTFGGKIFYVDITNKTDIKPHLEKPKVEWMKDGLKITNNV